MGQEIIVSAVIIRDCNGRLLTVRKRGTQLFMFPGGKPEPGETASQTAAREAREELGIAIDTEDLQPLGTFTHVFSHPYVDGAQPAHEIAELRWTDLTAPLPQDLAPLTRVVIPALIS